MKTDRERAMDAIACVVLAREADRESAIDRIEEAIVSAKGEAMALRNGHHPLELTPAAQAEDDPFAFERTAPQSPIERFEDGAREWTGE